MGGLMLKDFYTIKKQLLIMGVVVVIYGIYSIYSGDASMVSIVTVLFGMLAPVNLFSSDEQCKWDIYANTLPATLDVYVISRYVFCTAFLVVMAGLATGINLLVTVLHPENVLNLTFIIEFLGLGMIYIALFLPVLFKMGAERGRIFLMAMYMIPFCIILFLEQNKMMPNLSALPFSFQYVKIGAGILIAVLYGISVLVSLSIYRKKEF